LKTKFKKTNLKNHLKQIGFFKYIFLNCGRASYKKTMLDMKRRIPRKMFGIYEKEPWVGGRNPRNQV
jgi:hypothetical protein